MIVVRLGARHILWQPFSKNIMTKANRLGAVMLVCMAASTCGRADTGAATVDSAPSIAASAVQPAAVSAAEFGSLGWLIGDWRGSGGQYPAFYESYRFLNDSTIEQRSYADSTFAAATDSALIVYSNGSVSKSRGATANHVIQRLAGDTLYFARPNGGRGSFVWIKGAPGQWTAVLDGAGEGAPKTVYEMRRIRP